MLKLLIICTILEVLLVFDNVKAKPQGMEDLQAGAVMVFAAAKGAVDNGAAAKDTKEFEFFGVKAKNDMAVGFGDAMKEKRSTSDSSSDESYRRKRSATFDKPIKDISKLHDKENEFLDYIRNKRSNSDESSLSDFSSFSVSTSSSSSESEETERRKRSASFEILTNDIINMYKN